MPEYYLTDCELEIFNQQRSEIVRNMILPGETFDLVEPGAGDGSKTKILLEYLVSQTSTFKYIPVDISWKALQEHTGKTKQQFPELIINPQPGDYFEVLTDLHYCDICKKILLFLGSNIGNYTESETLDFYHHLSTVMLPGDLVLTGFDLIKDPSVIMAAYDDPRGLTRDFNLNLLSRFNREQGADFHPDNFKHHPVYDPTDNAAKSFLVSREKQSVYVKDLDKVFTFDSREYIFTEMLRKFNPEMIELLAHQAGFRVVKNFFDHRLYFADSLWEKL